MSDKPRECWAELVTGEHGSRWFHAFGSLAAATRYGATLNQEFVHMIEYSAYEGIKRELYETNIKLDQEKFSHQNCFEHWHKALAERDETRADLAASKLPFSMDRHLELIKAFEAEREKSAKLQEQLDHEVKSVLWHHEELAAEKTKSAKLVEALRELIGKHMRMDNGEGRIFGHLVQRGNQALAEYESQKSGNSDTSSEHVVDGDSATIMLTESYHNGELVSQSIPLAEYALLQQRTKDAEATLQWYAQRGPCWSLHSKSMEPTFSQNEAKRAVEYFNRHPASTIGPKDE